jgi:hypothetical protein
MIPVDCISHHLSMEFLSLNRNFVIDRIPVVNYYSGQELGLAKYPWD